jgi:hypothetical protein
MWFDSDWFSIQPGYHPCDPDWFSIQTGISQTGFHPDWFSIQPVVLFVTIVSLLLSSAGEGMYNDNAAFASISKTNIFHSQLFVLGLIVAKLHF